MNKTKTKKPHDQQKKIQQQTAGIRQAGKAGIRQHGDRQAGHKNKAKQHGNIKNAHMAT